MPEDVDDPREAEGIHPDDIDPGEPVEEIAGLREDVSPGLLHGVRNSIQRRLAAAQWLDLAVNGAFAFLKEIGDLVFGLVGPRADGEEEGDKHE